MVTGGISRLAAGLRRLRIAGTAGPCAIITIMHYLLFYEVADDYVTRRAPFRSAHLKKAWEASERGEIVLAGALANPADGAVFLFQGDSPAAAERFAQTDPYVTEGVVKRWYVREWTTVVGAGAATPVRP
jgi:uncharacterized protein YciI